MRLSWLILAMVTVSRRRYLEEFGSPSSGTRSGKASRCIVKVVPEVIGNPNPSGEFLNAWNGGEYFPIEENLLDAKEFLGPLHALD
jgi:hypothetical protein